MARSIKKKKKGNFGYTVFKRFAIPVLYLANNFPPITDKK
jgi:hypothetical protein